MRRDPVGVSAGAAAAHQRGQPGDALGGVCLGEAAGDLLHGGGDRVQAVNARPALPGALIREPARHACGFGDGAGVGGEQKHDAGAERGGVGREMFVGERDAARQTRPAIQLPPYPPTSSARGSPRCSTGSVDQRVQRRAVLDLVTPGWATAPDSVTSADPGWEGVPSCAKPLGSVTGDQRDVGQRLGVGDERGTPPDAPLEDHRRGERRDRGAAVADG